VNHKQLLKTSEGEHKFTQLRGLVEEETLREKLRKTNRKFIQLRRLAEANLRISGRWHRVSPYRRSRSQPSLLPQGRAQGRITMNPAWVHEGGEMVEEIDYMEDQPAG
jgi:hypothetical protein